jgi:hypothetical protein
MIVHQSRRTALTLSALLIAGMTLGAPAAMAAGAPHARIPHHVLLQAPITSHIVRPGLEIQQTDRAFAPRFPAAQSRSSDPFADLHFE